MSLTLSQLIQSSLRKTQHQPPGNRTDSPERRDVPSNVPPPLNKLRPFLSRTPAETQAVGKIGVNIKSKIQSGGTIPANWRGNWSGRQVAMPSSVPKLFEQANQQRMNNLSLKQMQLASGVGHTISRTSSRRVMVHKNSSPVDILTNLPNNYVSTTSIQDKLIDKSHLAVKSESFKQTTSQIFIDVNSQTQSKLQNSNSQLNLYQRLSAYKQQQPSQQASKMLGVPEPEFGIKQTDSKYSYSPGSHIINFPAVTQCSKIQVDYDIPPQRTSVMQRKPSKGISERFQQALRQSNCSPVRDVEIYQSNAAHFNFDNEQNQIVASGMQNSTNFTYVQTSSPFNEVKQKTNITQFPDFQSTQQTTSTPNRTSAQDYHPPQQPQPSPSPPQMRRSPTFGFPIQNFAFSIPSKIAVPPSIPRYDSQPLLSTRKAPGLRKKIFFGIRPHSLGIQPDRYFKVTNSCCFDFMKEHRRSASVVYDKAKIQTEVPEAIAEYWAKLKQK